MTHWRHGFPLHCNKFSHCVSAVIINLAISCPNLVFVAIYTPLVKSQARNCVVSLNKLCLWDQSENLQNSNVSKSTVRVKLWQFLTTFHPQIPCNLLIHGPELASNFSTCKDNAVIVKQDNIWINIILCNTFCPPIRLTHPSRTLQHHYPNPHPHPGIPSMT